MNVVEEFEKRATPLPPEVVEAVATGGAGKGSAGDNGVRLAWASEITPEPVAWLWNGWLAAGKLHILGGIAGTGKTTLALSLASIVTTGGTFPDGSRCQQSGRVLIWSGEDGDADTLVPRLHAAGADVSKVAIIQGVRENGAERPFDPGADLEELASTLERLGDVRLLIVDSIVSAVTGDSHANTEVRRSLQPFVDMGTKFGCAVLGITHFSKGTGGRNPLERVTGSVAFGALARLVLVASKSRNPEDESACVFARAKSNLGPDTGGFGYDLEQCSLENFPDIMASRIQWGQALEGDAGTILDKAEAPAEEKDGNRKTETEGWLRDLLSTGPMIKTEVEAKGKEEGYTEKTIRSAREKLNVVIRREGFGREMKSWWSLPDNQRNPARISAAAPFMPSNSTHAHSLSEGITEKEGTNGQIPMPFTPEAPP